MIINHRSISKTARCKTTRKRSFCKSQTQGLH